MQCKDIADEDFLDAVRIASALTGGGWAMYWDVACVLGGHREHVGQASSERRFHDEDCLPDNLVRAKAKKLIDKKKMDGCPCGCRGDFEVLGPDGLPEDRGGYVALIYDGDTTTTTRPPISAVQLAMMAQSLGAARTAFAGIAGMIQHMARSLRPAMEQLARAQGVDLGPTDPRERALWLRRNRNTGPKPVMRAPRSLGPRGTR